MNSVVEFTVIETGRFQEEFKKRVPREIRRQFLTQLERLRTNPYGIGKPLGYRWLRELKAKNFRVYYFIVDAHTLVLLSGASDKKTQATIERIRDEFIDNIFISAGGARR